MGESDKAVELISKAISINPSSPKYHSNLGNAFQIQGKLDEASASYRQALVLEPGFAEAHINLGTVFLEQGKLDEAISSYQRALKAQGKPNATIESFNRALSLKPGYAMAHAGLGGIYIDLGQFEIARVELSKALESEPEHPVAWATLTMLRKMTLEDEAWLNTAIKLVSQDKPKLPAKEIIGLRFAIGKYYDDTMQYDLAFPAYRQANALKRQIEGGLDRQKLSRMIDALITTYTTDFARRRREGASQSRRPVLIVGMPRSGTSLTEQIIASHPEAFGAGEQYFWYAQAQANQATVLSGNYDAEFVAGIASGYEQSLQQHSTEAARIVDKMPSNFLWLGLINSIFPQARFIHMQRNPVDTCLSIYFQNFNFSHSYGTDLDDLAFYYREYARLMNHWRRVLPADRFLDVPYEALTHDQAGWSRRIIEFIGLEWDERCLDFHAMERKVGTLSNWQVRQKIYHTSKARWRHYEKHLGPLLGLLELGLA